MDRPLRAGDPVSAGIVAGTHVGYLYVWSWPGDAREQFADAMHELTQDQRVDGPIIDLRYNEGGFIHAPTDGLGELRHRVGRTATQERDIAGGRRVPGTE